MKKPEKHYYEQFVKMRQKLAAVTAERNRYRAVCERLVNRWDKQSPTWPIADIVEMAREALKGGKA